MSIGDVKAGLSQTNSAVRDAERALKVAGDELEAALAQFQTLTEGSQSSDVAEGVANFNKALDCIRGAFDAADRTMGCIEKTQARL